MRYKVVIILILLFIITGCSQKTTPLEAYRNLKENRIASKINLSLITNPLLVDKTYKFDLKISDSLIIYGNDEKIYANYKDFNIDLKSNKKYKIKISSLCDCFGFTKYMFIPLVSVLNQNGMTMKLESQPDTFDYSHGPLSLNKTWILENLTNNNSKIIVSSNNVNLGQDLYKFFTYPIPMTINIKTSLVGKFNITIEEIK